MAQILRIEDTLGLACKVRADNAGPLYLFLNFILEIFHLAPRHPAGMTETSLQFHVKANDYFGTVATVLDLVRQDLDRRGYKPHGCTLSRLRDDLVYLSAPTGSRKSSLESEIPSLP